MKKLLAGFLVADCLPMKGFFQPLLTFAFRFYVAFVFFKSGLSKLGDGFSVSQSTKQLFAYEYNVPLLSSDVAAFLATYAELFLPVLLVIGLFSRPVALALFILNAVAAYVLAQTDFASAAGHWQHVLWGAMLAVIFAFGPGKISIDSWLSDKWTGENANLVLRLIGIIAGSVIGYFALTKLLG